MYDYVEEGGTKVYISKVGKNPDIPVFNKNETVNNINIIDDDAGKAMDNFFMLRDFVDGNNYMCALINNTLINTEIFLLRLHHAAIEYNQWKHLSRILS